MFSIYCLKEDIIIVITIFIIVTRVWILAFVASGEQRTAFFDVRVCYLDAGSLRDLSPKDIYRQHENEKKRQYVSRVMEVEQGTSARYLFLLPQPERQRNVRGTTTD